MISKDKCTNALVVEGGAMRGVFAAGVLDTFIKEHFYPFDLCIGVSAGANNLAAYLAGMYQYSYRIYTDYMLRPNFINWLRFLRGGHLLDLDWLWEITQQEVFTDNSKLFTYQANYVVVVTEVSSGKAVYLEPDAQNLYDILKAACAIPAAYRGFPVINGVEMTDGGVADPLPVNEAYKRGAKNIVVIRSYPYDYCFKNSIEKIVCRLFLRKKASLVKAMLNNIKVYKESLDFIRNPPQGINIIEVNTPIDFQVESFTVNAQALKKDYLLGVKAGNSIIDRWCKSCIN